MIPVSLWYIHVATRVDCALFACICVCSLQTLQAYQSHFVSRKYLPSFANFLIGRMLEHGSHTIPTMFVNRGRSEEVKLGRCEAYQPMNNRTNDLLPLLMHHEHQGLSVASAKMCHANSYGNAQLLWQIGGVRRES